MFSRWILPWARFSHLQQALSSGWATTGIWSQKVSVCFRTAQYHTIVISDLDWNKHPLGIFTRKYPESTKIHQFCHTQNAGVLNPSESASVDISWIRQNPPLTCWWIFADSGYMYHAHMKICIVCCCIESIKIKTVHVTIIHQPTWPSS